MTSRNPAFSITIRDVAAAVGVSVSTVSRALRNDPCISQARREAIQSRAQQLGYRPNPLVSALMAQVRPRRHAHHPVAIAILQCYPRNQTSFSEYYEQGIRERAEMFGYRIEPLFLDDLSSLGRRLDRVLDARGIRGLIVLPVPAGVVLDAFSYERLAASTVDPSLKRPHLHRASSDYFQGMTTALERLTTMGYKRIGFVIAATEAVRIGDLWLGAYLRWQLTLPPKQRLAVHMPRQNTRQAFTEWLRREKPDALVSNEPPYLLEWLAAAGVSIPHDIAYACLGGQHDGLTAGIDQHEVQVGWTAFDLVVSQLNRNEYGLPTVPQMVLVEGVWVDGPTAVPRN